MSRCRRLDRIFLRAEEPPQSRPVRKPRRVQGRALSPANGSRVPVLQEAGAQSLAKNGSLVYMAWSQGFYVTSSTQYNAKYTRPAMLTLALAHSIQDAVWLALPRSPLTGAR